MAEPATRPAGGDRRFPMQVIAAVTLMALSAILRQLGLYSDIALLYGRDKLWQRPIPYVDYPNEYPVGIGVLSWLLSYLPGGRTAYLLATAALLILAGVLILRLGRRFAGAKPWLFAASPALLWYAALNWDLAALLLLVAALLALRDGRDALGGGLLGAAVWTKFFPIVLVPLVILDRLLKRRWRDAAAFGATFGAVSVAMNAPFALALEGGRLQVRENWLRFFRFNQARPQEANLWAILDWAGIGPDTAAINRASQILLLVGLAAVAALLALAYRRVGDPTVDLLLPAAIAAIGWWLFINKVYSPQYSLWLVVLLMLIGAPTRLAVAFALADTAWFVAILLAVAQRGWADWMHAPLLLPPLVLREALILAIVIWGARRLAATGTPAPVASPRAAAERRAALDRSLVRGRP